MPSYDSTVLPAPGPIARVRLRNPATGQELSNVPMLIDSGCEISFLPAGPLRRWSLQPSGKRYQLVALDGRKMLSPAIRLELEVGGRIFRGLFLLAELEWGILGRNVLDHLVLIMNGPQQTWSIGR